MALKGTLKDFGIADILQLIGQQQKTGTLHLKQRDQEVHVAFKDGAIVRAESTHRKKKELIGTMLVRAELITEQQLASALETQRRTLKRLGDVLVAAGMITHERFTEMVKLQTTETLYGLFGWKSGTYEFEQGEIEFDPSAAVTLRAESVLMEGFRMVDEWPVIKKTITSYELTFERLKELPPPPLEADAFDAALDDAFAEEKREEKQGEFKSIGPNERKVMGLAVAGRDVRRLIDLSCLGEFETCKALLNLVNLGYLKVIPPTGRTHAVGGGAEAGVLGRVMGAVGRVAISMLVLAAIGLVASRINLQAFSLTSSPSSFADPAAQRLISRAQMARIHAALDVYRVERGELPEQLQALVEAGLLADNDIRYPWQEPYYYRRTRDAFVLLPPLR
ncbi:MAG: DUF4388 domain-containing protein [Myxococcaceae bacterium]|nr:DUF4388 domain-containing protein [Myxococcaceae bacterium]